MRVGFLASGIGPESGGAFTLESTLLHAISERSTNHELYFYSYRDLPVAESAQRHLIRLNSSGLTSKRVENLIRQSKLLTIARRALGTLRHNETLASLVHSHQIDLFWYLGGFEPVTVPFAFTVLDCQHRIQPYFPEVSVDGWCWQDREDFHRNAQRAAYVITGTQEGATQMQRYYQIDPERFRIIPLPVAGFTTGEDVIPTRPKDLWITTPFVFYPAQFWPHKNHYTLIKAIKIINESRPEAPLSLVLSGADKGNRHYIFRLIREHGLENRVQMLPFVTQAEMLWLYDHAFALTFPSLFGPDNLPPLEAFQRRCPVVASRIPGTSEQLGEAPLYHNPLDEHGLARQLEALRSNPGIREQCITRGLSQLQGKGAFDYAEKVFSVIDEFEKLRRLWK